MGYFIIYIVGGFNLLFYNNLKSICYDFKRDCLYIGIYMGGFFWFDCKIGCFYNYFNYFMKGFKEFNDVIF